MSSSQVRFMSSIIACIGARGARPAAAKVAVEISGSALPSACSPSALASRRAGSMVHDQRALALHGGAQRERGRDRGLAHAPAADGDEDVARLEGGANRVDGHFGPPSRAATCSTAWRLKSGTKSRFTVTTGIPSVCRRVRQLADSSERAL